jgi:hypothetical protein
LKRATSSLLSRLQYFVGGHLGAITPVAPQTITPAPSAWKHVAVAAPIPVVPPVIRAILLLSLPVRSILAMPRPALALRCVPA